jgi:acid phosphatase type 7
MKVTSRLLTRAAFVLSAAGAIAAFGACSDNKNPVAPPPPPPPPPTLAAPTNLVGTAISAKQINLTWVDNDTNETGFRLERCSGPGCTTFAQVGTNLAVNATAFSDTGLTASTSYTYRIRSFNAKDTSAWTMGTPVTTLATTASGAFTLVGAGEITTCASSSGPIGTAHVVDSLLAADSANTMAFTAGDNLADTASGTTFQTCFDGANKWGAFKNKTAVSLGNADFMGGRGPTGVYGYFGSSAGPADSGWYSFERGNWHIVVLNTSDWQHGEGWTYGIDAALNPQPSPQVDWLSKDLAANTKPCIAVISWERRFYTTGNGTLGYNSNMRPMSAIMYQYGVDLLISAKDKSYQRFAPMNPTTYAADSLGIRQFIVGTGGRTPDAAITGTPTNRDAYIPQEWGVLKLTLNDNSYSWNFINTSGTQTDSGTAACH